MAAQNQKKFPFEIKDLDKKTNDEMLKLFTGERDGFVQIGPKKYLMNKKYETQAADIYNLEVRPDDIFILTYPRSGTTWTQEIIWLVANDVNIEKALAKPLIKRFPFLEMHALANDKFIKELLDFNKDNPEATKALSHMTKAAVDSVRDLPSPRFIKSHLPLSLLPPKLIDTAKTVFVARNPLDVAVSHYHHNRLIQVVGYVGDFKTYWNYFVRDLVQYTPFFEMIKEAWAYKDHPNMLFLFYEDMVKDLPKAIEQVSQFLGKKLTEEQLKIMCDHLSFENFKNNKSVNMEPTLIMGIAKEGEQGFIRKGKSGGWRSYFDEEMTRQAEQWIEENLRDTDLRFPSV